MPVAKDKLSPGDGQTSLGEAAARYLSQLSPEERVSRQQEVYRFVKWFAFERDLDKIPVSEIAHYAEKEASAGGNFQLRLESVRGFLTYARKEKVCRTALATHLRTSRVGTRAKKASAMGNGRQSVAMTAEEHASLQQHLDSLKAERPNVAEELHRAAADKDFRENAPLDAARVRQGHMEAKIRELEATLATAVVLTPGQAGRFKVDIGDTAVLYDLSSQAHARYTLVGLSQVDPTKGRVSHVSPIGRALMGRVEGDIVEVKAPVGVLRYRIEKIER